ncbi:MAG TPA: 2-oxoisovalerate dehydrogenase [Bacteroidota bacterium]|nr:2-oxoisovalerate dehydrogenase [Candidatus Kapabacteria bacterium]HRS00969.1 2-oxoisovalerate dehydrogenase [Bacteroidota bacterium]
MDEIIFVIEEDAEGGYTARALNFSIFTEGDSIEELKANINDAVRCHFEGKDVPL